MTTSTAEGQRVMDLHGQRVVIPGATSGTGGRGTGLTNPVLVCLLFDDLGGIDHVVFTADEPLPLS
jgi:hypothetical protein